MVGSAQTGNGPADAGRHFSLKVESDRELPNFNDNPLLPVELNKRRNATAEVKLSGFGSDSIYLWNFQSQNQCLKKPKDGKSWIHIQFVRSGRVDFKCFSGRVIGDVDTPILAGFDDLQEFRASDAFDSLGVAFSPQALIKTNQDLTGTDDQTLPSLMLSSSIANAGLKALYFSIRSAYSRLQYLNPLEDQELLLIQEIIGYQLLSAWPTKPKLIVKGGRYVQTERLRLAMDFIEENLSSPLTLEDIARASGVSVRTLQDMFRRLTGQTPFQYIIEKKLRRAHQDLLDRSNHHLTIRDIARRWGFTHAGDFGKRYKLLFGCTPKATAALTRTDQSPGA